MLPNLVIIGAMKSGTSSLHRYLNLHPQIYMSSLKELDFFILEKNWKEGISWYEQQFVTKEKNIKIYGESSPNYTKSHIFAGVPERMLATIPQAKLIYILRDPVKRILSHYYHQAVDSKETRPLYEALAEKDNNYLLTSHYYLQLKKFLDCYPKDQLLVLTLAELDKYPAETLAKVFGFLGVDESFTHPNFSRNYHSSSDKTKLNNLGRFIGKFPAGLRLCSKFPSLFSEDLDYPELDPKIHELIKRELRSDINKLRLETGQQFSEWML
ncbi:MAG: sulfotransferase domain-containing protein [Limnothrix sp. RL_2_0]|nr:sulfotransferase domain-containing protein [Limnothrix sp. RL_2_0]